MAGPLPVQQPSNLAKAVAAAAPSFFLDSVVEEERTVTPAVPSPAVQGSQAAVAAHARSSVQATLFLPRRHVSALLALFFLVPNVQPLDQYEDLVTIHTIVQAVLRTLNRIWDALDRAELIHSGSLPLSSYFGSATRSPRISRTCALSVDGLPAPALPLPWSRIIWLCRLETEKSTMWPSAPCWFSSLDGRHLIMTPILLFLFHCIVGVPWRCWNARWR